MSDQKNDTKQNDDNDLFEMKNEFSSKQVKLSDISKLCFDSRLKSSSNSTNEKLITIDDESEDKLDDVFIIKPIEHKKFGVKTKSASSLTDKQQPQQQSSSSSVYTYVYDGLGGHKKLFNSNNNPTGPTNPNTNNFIRKNLTKSKVTKSPFV